MSPPDTNWRANKGNAARSEARGRKGAVLLVALAPEARGRIIELSLRDVSLSFTHGNTAREKI